MSIFSRIGCKDIDLHILQHLNDGDLVSMMLVNKQALQLLSLQSFWRTRTFNLVHQTKSDEFVNSFQQQNSTTWKEYYISLTSALEHPFPTFQAAMATDQKREDMVHLLQYHKNAQPIIKHEENDDYWYKKYYTAQHTKWQEGPCYIQFHNSLQSIFRLHENGHVCYRCTMDTNERTTETQYRHGLYSGKVPMYEQSFVTKWRKKGMKMKEEQFLASGKVSVRTWFANGNQRSEGVKTKYGKKTGDWKEWNKDGEFLGVARHRNTKTRAVRFK